MKKVYINSNTDAVVITSCNNDYEYEGSNSFYCIFTGSLRACHQYIENYWEDNCIIDDARMILND